MKQVFERDVPQEALQGVKFERIDFADAFQAPLTKHGISIHESYQVVFANQPGWVKGLMSLRTWLVAPFGLKGGKGLSDNYLALEPAYQVGDKICGWEIYAQDDDMLITGMNDKHLDFRVCFQRYKNEGSEKIVLSTIVKLNNVFGSMYLKAIMPFHKRIAKALIENAVQANRI